MKTTWLLCLLSFCALAQAQTSVNLYPVSGFQIASNDLLNFNVIHTSNEPVQVQFQVIVEQKSGQRGQFLELHSAKHVLKPGINTFNTSNFNITRKRFASSEMATYEMKMNSFPMGDYSYCVRIICQDAPATCEKMFEGEITYNACSDFRVLPMTPLLLASPEDEAKLKIKRPNFSWIPPMPLGNDPDISYEFTLVHLNEKQKGEDGIRRNRPLYKRDRIPEVALNFPTTLEDLIPGEHYAWQVKAHLGEVLVGTSEVWEFEIVKPVDPPRYVRLNHLGNSAIYNYLERDTVYFIHISEYPNTPFELSIRGSNLLNEVNALTIDKEIVKVAVEEAFKSQGLNTYKFSLAPYALSEGIYELILTQDNTNWKMKFRINNE